MFTISPQIKHSSSCGRASIGSEGAAARSQEGGQSLAARAGATQAWAAQRGSCASAFSSPPSRADTRGQLSAPAHSGTGCRIAPTTTSQSSYSHLKFNE